MRDAAIIATRLAQERTCQIVVETSEEEDSE